MARDSPEVRFLRESLEGALHPATASAVLFEALQAYGGLPDGPAATLAMVQGPLREAVARRVGPQQADQILARSVQMLDTLVHPDRPVPGSGPNPAPLRREDDTRPMIRIAQAVPVLVVSASAALPGQLLAALGPDVVAPSSAVDDAALAARLAKAVPAVVLIDGGEFPHVEPSGLVAHLASLPHDTICALWGTDLPYGMTVLAEAQTLGARITSFDRREGLEPLVELIRARRE